MKTVVPRNEMMNKMQFMSTIDEFYRISGCQIAFKDKQSILKHI